jgi:hypothetical protein
MIETHPLDTKSSSNRNVHVVSHDRKGNTILAPGPFGRNAALVSVAFLPVLLYLCHLFSLDKGLWLAASLFPLLAAGGFLVGHIGYSRFGTRVVLDSSKKKILISGLRHANRPDIPFESVQAIQLLDAGTKHAPKAGAWHAYQINLVLKDKLRYNLLDSGSKKQLDHIGEQIAQCLKVPFERHTETANQKMHHTK